MDKKAFYKLTYGLYIVSAMANGREAGCVVNTLNQVTSEPAQMSVTVNKDNFTTDIIRKAGKFAAVALLQDVSMDTIAAFGFRSSKDSDKFEGISKANDKAGMPYVNQEAAARYSCDVVQEIDLGSHVMFIGKVTEAEVISQDEVLTYAHYQTVKKGGTPKNAPSYKGEEEAKSAESKGYRCSVCGYVHEGDTLPEGFTCPWCNQPADKFVKL